MSVLIIFIKLIVVFDLLVIAVYFGGDILSTMLNKLRRKAKQEDSEEWETKDEESDEPDADGGSAEDDDEDSVK